LFAAIEPRVTNAHPSAKLEWRHAAVKSNKRY
jgi:hypothetical protein